MKPQITVIIPCHDSDDYIGGIIGDLNAQTIQTFHVVFVDDNSANPLKEVLKEFRIDFPYKVIETVAGTAGGARNAAFASIKAPFTYFVDSDDRQRDRVRGQSALQPTERDEPTRRER